MNELIEYHVQVELPPGSVEQWYTVARSVTAEGAGELVRVLVAHADRKAGCTLRVVIVKSIQTGA